MKKSQLILISTLLSCLGGGIFIYKFHFLNFPLKPDRMSRLWDIEVSLFFEANNRPLKAELFLPHDFNNFIMNSEYFLSGKYGLVVKKQKGSRKAIWSIRKVRGRQHLYYRIRVQKSAGIKDRRSNQAEPLDLPSVQLEAPYYSAARRLWNDIYDHSADLDTIIGNLFKRLNQPKADENVSLLLGENGSSQAGKVEAAVQLLAIAGIPARMVNGFDLKEDTLTIKMIHWLEVYYQGKWYSYVPDNPGSEVPESYMAWWVGPEPLYKIKGGTKSRIQVNALKNEDEAIFSAIRQSKLVSPRLMDFSLLNLPIQNQQVYRVILLIPLGALLVVLFRNVVGINTFGTFMPVLIALSFRETELFWGVILFSIVIAAGLMIRFYLETLKLLVVPRLSAVLIAVIIIIATLNILTHNMGLSLGISVSLFPLVIIAMTIERMSIIWEERGASDAMKQGAGTLFVSIMIYTMVKNQTIEHIMFFFPELLLLLLAITLLLGRYSGFRLLELYRFREFARKE